MLAGTVALEDALGFESGAVIPFCGGRSDAVSSYPDGMLVPGQNLSDVLLPFHWQARVRGLDVDELVAITARSRSASQMQRMGFIPGTWMSSVNSMSNEYFSVLLNNVWTPVTAPNGDVQYTNGANLYMTALDMQILNEPTLRDIAINFASSNSLFIERFVSGWIKMMNSDRFSGPIGNLCN